MRLGALAEEALSYTAPTAHRLIRSFEEPGISRERLLFRMGIARPPRPSFAGVIGPIPEPLDPPEFGLDLDRCACGSERRYCGEHYAAP